MHGYDVIDHARLNPEIGTDGDLDALAAALQQRGHGPASWTSSPTTCASPARTTTGGTTCSRTAAARPSPPFFDIDWHPPKTELHEKVLLPVLGEQYGRVLENQEITIDYEAGAFHARYYGQRASRSGRARSCRCSSRSSPTCAAATRADHPDVLEIESIVTATTHLPTRWDTEPEKVRERMREKEIVKRRLDALVSGSAAVRDALERSLARDQRRARATRAASTGWRRCSADQAYRLSFWGVAAEEINYRRFFDINDLAAIRVELPQRAGRRSRQGVPAAARGQGDRPAHRPRRRPDRSRPLPRAPAARLRRRLGRSGPARRTGGASRLQTYVVVEKILTGDEALPRRVAGARHHRLRVPEHGQRPVRRRRAARARSSASTSACARDAASSTICSTARSA